jgi:hypothetical protein
MTLRPAAGWKSPVKEGSAAVNSLSLGLYFIVHEPLKDKNPLSTPMREAIIPL